MAAALPLMFETCCQNFNSINNLQQYLSSFVAEPGFTVEATSKRSVVLPKQSRICLLCLHNSIGDEKHYLFHCTNDDLLDLRIKFIKQFFEDNNTTNVGPSSMKDVMIKLL